MDQLKSALPEGLRIGKIHHVAIIVRDLEAVLDLYRDKLGLTVETVMSIPYDRVTIASCGGRGQDRARCNPTTTRRGGQVPRIERRRFPPRLLRGADIQAALRPAR